MKKTCKNTTFQEPLDARVKFCKERNWDDSLNNTKAILTALTAELGEFAEKDQYWKPDSEDEKKKVMYEMIDIFNYLGGLISQIDGKDFCELYFEKMEKLAIKYPANADVSVHKKNKEEYRRSGKNELYKD